MQPDTATAPGAGPGDLAANVPNGNATTRTEELLQVAGTTPGPSDKAPLPAQDVIGGQAPTPSTSPTDTAAPQPANSTPPAGLTSPSASSAPQPADTTPDLAKTGGAGGDAGAGGGEKRLGTNRPFDPERGSNVVFVLDRSLSMRSQGKSMAARRELVSTLQHLGANKSFYVVFFPYKAMPAPRPLPATPENINSMTNWIFSTGHAYGSDPSKAVEHGLQFDPDTVWLLSDGRFSTSAARAIRDANEVLKARIHTVAFYSREGEAVMRRIADENGGTFRFVPPPEQPSPAGSE